jgi:hypothetical protein
MKVTPFDCSLRLKLIIEHYSGPPTFHPAQGTRAGSIYKLPSTSTLATAATRMPYIGRAPGE